MHDLRSYHPGGTRRGGPRLGGWLMLVAIVLLLSSISYFIMANYNLVILFTEEGREILNTPGENYSPYWEHLFTFELAGSALLFLFSMALLILMFLKKRFVPKLMIILQIAIIGFYIADKLIALTLLSDVIEQSVTDILLGTVQTILPSAIIIAYFTLSNRVKETFIR